MKNSALDYEEILVEDNSIPQELPTSKTILTPSGSLEVSILENGKGIQGALTVGNFTLPALKVNITSKNPGKKQPMKMYKAASRRMFDGMEGKLADDFALMCLLKGMVAML